MALRLRQGTAVDGLRLGQRWTRRGFGRWAHQVALSETLAVETDAGQLVAVVGLYDLGREQYEAWFAAGPAARANLLGLLRIVRQVLQVAEDTMPGATVRAYIDPGSVAGPRLATILGFAEAGPTETDSGVFETWLREL